MEGLRNIEGEANRAERFRDFIRRVFPNVEVGGIRGFYPELERYLKAVGVGQVVRGRADALFGSLLLEFEPVLDEAHEKDAREQLSKYVMAIWSAQADLGQPRGRLTTVATDGVVFVVYRPRSMTSRGPVALEHVVLEEVDRLDVSTLRPEDAYAWLKRYVITAAEELRPVDPDEFAREFGVGSRVFNRVLKMLRIAWNIAKEGSSTLYEQWESHLRIVYGSAVGSEDLYLRHTYLASLAKLVVYSAYSGGALPMSRDELVKILDGSIFREWRIVNFIEEDLFSWVHRVDEGVNAAQLIASSLSSYDLTTVTLDVFKEIYQGLVDPEARHDLGEYYTPDWLAEMIVGDVLGGNPYQSVLDPACGSGTFLAAAISLKKQRIKDLKPAELMNHILGNVVGVDVHPLAVIISRATYLTTLGRELLEYRVGDLVVPVYLSDSINLPTEAITVQGGVKVYSVLADGLELVIPADLAEYPLLADSVVDIVRDYVKDVVSGVTSDLGYFRSYILSRVPELKALDFGIIQALYYTAKNLVNLTNRKRDTVWGFILKNYYKPIFLNKRKFDVIVGNPPWLSYRYVRSIDYQKFLKELIVDKYALLYSEKVELMTHMELATLFLVSCADLYLKKDGVIGYVMPRSVFSADQHHNLRAGSLNLSLAVTKIVDLKEVSPLFNVPACILFCKHGAKVSYPIEGRVLSGRFPKKNFGYHSAMSLIEKNVRTRFELRQVGERSFLAQVGAEPTPFVSGRSPYYKNFRQGATIVPRPAWFTDIKPHPKLGLNPKMPYVITSSRAADKAKEAYKDVNLRGNVEADFLYGVLSGSELVPFGHLEPLIAVLPIEPNNKTGGYRLVQRSEARGRGFTGLEKWLKRVEEVWKAKRGEKAEKADVYQWLDYQGKLTAQSPSKKFKVLYNTSGTYLVSCVAENMPRTIRINGARIRLNGLVADAKIYWYETNNEDEAHYLSAILNSSYLDKLLKPMQTRGAFGERDIHKKPLEFPIPLYNPGDLAHRKLAELSKTCHKKTAQILPALAQKYRNIGKIRSEIKKHLIDEIAEIDTLVKKLIGAGHA